MEFNDVRLQYECLRDDIDRAIRGVLAGGQYILGPALHTFEKEFARYCRSGEGVGVASGTGALTIGLRALHVQPGDDVLVPAISAPATAMAVVSLGARPIFVDVTNDDFTMDYETAFERKTSRTRAVVPVHLYGMPAQLKDLMTLGVPMLEDAAQAHGSDASWGRCGSFGDAAAFSFYPTKNLGAYGDGGMLVTSQPGVAERARLLRNYGQRVNYDCDVAGENSRLDELQAAILYVKLKHLDDWNSRRRQIAARYREAFAGLPLGLQRETGKSNYHLFVVTTQRRDRLRAHLAGRDIPATIHYPVPLHRQKAFAEFNPARCPNADQLSARVLSLPIHAALTDGEVERVIEGVASFFKRDSGLHSINSRDLME